MANVHGIYRIIYSASLTSFLIRMTSSINHPPLLLFLLFTLLLSTTTSFDISIFHAQPNRTPSSTIASILSSAASDTIRLSFLSQSKATSIPIASGLQLTQTNTYVIRARLGTPPQSLLLSLDSGSDTSWLPCSSPSNSSFDPTLSSSYSTVDCSDTACTKFNSQACGADLGPGSACGYNISYGADKFTAKVSRDSIGLGTDNVDSYVFGCLDAIPGGSVLPKSGLLGLARGVNGLPAQTASLYQGVFSYCLPGYKSYYFSGSLRLGPVRQPKAIRTTPLLSNPHRPSLYYVNLTGVSLGRVNVAVPAGSFDFDTQTGAGTVVDSGTVITRFVAPAYAAIRDEFRRQVNASSYSSLGAFDTCFATNGEGPATPAVTLHFTGLDLRLPMENTLIHSSSQPLACLAFAAAPNNVNNVVNVIANFQQQNHRVLIDVANSKVGFARESCS